MRVTRDSIIASLVVLLLSAMAQAEQRTWSRADKNTLTLSCINSAVEQSGAAIIEGLGGQISSEGLEALLVVNREHIATSCQCITAQISQELSPVEVSEHTQDVIALSSALASEKGACAIDARAVLAEARQRYEDFLRAQEGRP